MTRQFPGGIVQRGLAIYLLVVAGTLLVSCLSADEPPRASYAFVRFLGGSGEGPGQFREPMGVDLGPSGELYVADTRNARIQVLSPEGEFLRRWGRGERGQSGDGQATNQPTPVRVSSNLDFTWVDTGALHTCGLTTDGEVWCWGQALFGELGNTSIAETCNGIACSSVPIRASDPTTRFEAELE